MLEYGLRWASTWATGPRQNSSAFEGGCYYRSAVRTENARSPLVTTMTAAAGSFAVANSNLTF